MILLVDFGNSRMKWACWRDGTLGDMVQADAQRDVSALLDAQWAALDRPTHVWIADVGGRTRRQKLREWLQTRWDMEPRFVQTQERAGELVNGYEDPTQLGVDRWLALIGAYRRKPGPLIVVDAGTALTIDVVARGGRHQGGLIVPGISLMRDALRKGTAIPKLQEAENSPALLARDTHTAVTGGTLYALVAYIDRVTGDLDHAVGGRAGRFLTGGDAEQLMPLLVGRYEHRPALVLEGLAWVAGDEI